MAVLKVSMWGQTPGIEWAEGVAREMSPNRSAYLIKNGVAVKLTGKSENTLVESIIIANTATRLSFGTVAPRRRDVHIFINPELLEKAHVSHAGTFHGDSGEYPLAIYVHAFKQINLDDYEWLAGVYVTD